MHIICPANQSRLTKQNKKGEYDARNNKNQSAVEDLKYIADRCHRVFWLNTDDPAKWNTGDSIIGIYESAGAAQKQDD